MIYLANPITGRIQVVTTHAATDRHPEYFKRQDFLVSDDPWFRPVAIHFGPDGFLYIVDWYKGTPKYSNLLSVNGLRAAV